MAIQTQTFSPDLLNNYFAFNRFFSGEEQIQQILQEDPATFKKSGQLYFSPGRVVWILLKAPFEWLLSLFFYVIAQCLECIGCERGHALLSVASKQIVRDQCQLDAQTAFKERLLVPCFNVAEISTWDLYCTPSLPASFVTDPLVKEMTWPAEFARDNEPFLEGADLLRFAHLRGTCRGCVAWFAYLFFKTKGHFSSEEDHVVAVARQFEKGVGRQPSLLHTLGLNSVFQFLKINCRQVKEAAFSEEQLCKKELSAENLKKVTDLPPGLYRMSYERHTMLYYKCSDSVSYLWSPMNDRGAIAVGAEVKIVLSEVFNFLSDKTEVPLSFIELLPQEERVEELEEVRVVDNP